MRVRVTLSMDEQLTKKAKEKAGLIPFSRYVESLLEKEVGKTSKSG